MYVCTVNKRNNNNKRNMIFVFCRGTNKSRQNFPLHLSITVNKGIYIYLAVDLA